MFNLTVEEYGERIASLTVGDFIIYYFLGYFFIILIQRIIGVEIDTDNKLRTNPKILLSLIFLYFFGLIGRFLDSYVSFANSFERVTLAGIVLVCVVYLLYKVIFSRNRGLVFFLFKNKNERHAKIDLMREASNNNLHMMMNKNTIDGDSQESVRMSKDLIAIFIIDIFVSALICISIFKLNIFLGFLILIFLYFFMSERIFAIRKFMRSRERSPGYFIRIQE